MPWAPDALPAALSRGDVWAPLQPAVESRALPSERRSGSMADLIRPVSKAAMWVAIVAIAAALLAPATATAQALYGAIVGTVADSSGAPVPGATVVATNPETGLKREAVSDTEGSYTFRNLPPGTYDLAIS